MTTRPATKLVRAINRGNYQAATWMLKSNPDLIKIAKKQSKVYELLNKQSRVKKKKPGHRYVVRSVDTTPCGLPTLGKRR